MENNNTTIVKVVISKSLLTDIADAIREATGTTEKLTIDQMTAIISTL